MIRPIKNEEVMLLTEFIYEAIFQKEGDKPIPRTIIQEPCIWIYIDGFGSKKDDHCLVAEVDGYTVGAVWVRCIKAFGHIDDSVPELAISLYPQYRGKGIGSELMKEMLKILREKGYPRTSLAVQKDNYAVKMYQKVGFEIESENDQEFMMVCNLK
ncbi:GNAT family N-acetyltransferase [Anaerotignum sp. MB30-C6]|uniref:GNAT family N-acetyltransferase n=1 Tax=Anaerotignum sp. MB30-C6 TaxID=3070814 RepID=UPI0027DAFB68|nr:GNAT family N-acetyltransferase [Anaerotignum sp. MB30-C6]WMI80785.1 GNAT family N-acetyltransferase [Anaerotignum sp. MB30-C6]